MVTHRLGAALLAVATAGCIVLTVDHTIPSSDALMDARLVGTWLVEDDETLIHISKPDGPDYRLSWVDDEGRGWALGARLGMMQTHYVLEVWLDDDVVNAPEDFESMVALLYTPLVVSFDVGALRIAALDVQAFQTMFEEESPSPWWRRDGDLILVGTDEERRAAIAAFLDHTDLWDDATTWRRVGS